MTYLAVITDRTTKSFKHVYLFNYLELLSLLPKLNSEIYGIEITEVPEVYDLSSFLKSADNLVPDDYWINLGKNVDNFLDDYDLN